MNFSVIYESYESRHTNVVQAVRRVSTKKLTTTTMSTVSVGCELVGWLIASWSTKNHNRNRNIPENHQRNCLCRRQPNSGGQRQQQKTGKYSNYRKKSFNSFVLCSVFLIMCHQAENGKTLNEKKTIFRVIKNQQISMRAPTHIYSFRNNALHRALYFQCVLVWSNHRIASPPSLSHV